MKEWVGHSAKVFIRKDGVELFFSAREITSVTPNHISFLDRYNNLYTFRLEDVAEIKALEA